MKIVLAGIESDEIDPYIDLKNKTNHDLIFAEDYERSLEECKRNDLDVVVLGSHFDIMKTKNIFNILKESSINSVFPQVLHLYGDSFDFSNSHEQNVICNDFLITPVPLELFTTKIESLGHVHQLNHIIDKKEKEIILYEERLSHEKNLSQKIFEKISSQGALTSTSINYFISQSAVYNGEMLLAAERPSGDLVVMLGDFAGFGIPAAVGAYPASDIFYSLISKGFNLGHVIFELNKKLKKILPKEVFCRACIVEIDNEKNELMWWSSGFPDAMIVRSNGEVERIHSVHNIPLGIIDEKNFKSEIQTIPFRINDKVYLYTPEILKAIDSKGSLFDLNNLKAFLKKQKKENIGIDYIHGFVENFVDTAFYTRPTLLELTAKVPVPIKEKYYAIENKEVGLRDWKIELEFHIKTLREYDPLPMLLNILMETPALKGHKSSLYTILSELYTNALDHGLLRLDSKIKQSPTGFIDYLTLKQTRMKEMAEGTISFQFTNCPTPTGGLLGISVEDSGVGFDHEKISNANYNSYGYSGRGILLLKGLCDTVCYNKKGNRIEIGFSWSFSEAPQDSNSN